MEALIKRLEAKVDKLDDRLDSVDKTLILQEANLKEHMKRSDLLEKKLEPVERHVNAVNTVFKLIGVVASLATIAKLFLALLGK